MNKRNKLRAMILAVCYVFIFTCLSFASSSNNPTISNYIELSTKNKLNTIGDSTITTTLDFTNDSIASLTLSKNGTSVIANMTYNKNSIKISPANYLEGDITYSIKIITQSNKKYIIKVVAVNNFDYDTNDKIITDGFPELPPQYLTPSGNRIIEITAKPSKGFNYPYLLLIPSGTMENTSKKFMVVEPNNSEIASDALTYHEDLAKMVAHAYGCITSGAGGFETATALKTPLLVPVLPRPQTDFETIYPQFLNRGALLTQDKDMKRIDLQLVAMIKDAQQLLKTKGITVEQKVFMAGFSSSAKFTQRFATLQPDMVKAICVGGIAGSTILPIKEYKGEKLKFPVGINDIKEITGKEFNSTSYKKIAQYQYMGQFDSNDATHFPDCFEEQDAQQIWRLFGQNQMPDRWIKTQEILKNQGYDKTMQFHTYRKIGHNLSENIFSDIVEFFKANSGDTFKKIKTHDNG